MDELDLSHAQWRTSSYSSANGQCVEIATNLPGIIAVRDSKQADGPKLTFTGSAWAVFIHELKDRQPGR